MSWCRQGTAVYDDGGNITACIPDAVLPLGLALLAFMVAVVVSLVWLGVAYYKEGRNAP